jgi:hypothetical protein
MKDLLVPAKQAVQLKELGFDEPCLFGYNQDDENKLFGLFFDGLANLFPENKTKKKIYNRYNRRVA